MRCSPALPALLAGLALAGCFSTSFETSWRWLGSRDNDFADKRVAAVFVGTEEGERRAAEEVLARALTVRGTQGVAAGTLLAAGDLEDEVRARAKLLAAGCSGVVTMRVTDAEDEVRASPNLWKRLPYASFAHYSAYAWARARSDPPSGATVSLETLVYDLEQDRLMWAGISGRFDPARTAERVESSAADLTGELVKVGLVRP